jgi:hypothetical protein
LKTYNIELQRVKSMSEGSGLIHAQIDASVSPAVQNNEGKPPTTTLTLTHDTARVLQQLLKTQLGEIDKRKARSQR